MQIRYTTDEENAQPFDKLKPSQMEDIDTARIDLEHLECSINGKRN